MGQQSQDQALQRVIDAVIQYGVIDHANEYVHIDFRGSDPNGSLREGLRNIVGENIGLTLGRPSSTFVLPCLTCTQETLEKLPRLRKAVADAQHEGRTLENHMRHAANRSPVL